MSILHTFAPACPYCKGITKHENAPEPEPGFVGDEATRWVCPTCGAYARCMDGTACTIEGVANMATRAKRREAQVAFDGMWSPGGRDGKMGKQAARNWLAEELKVPEHTMQMANMTDKMLDRVLTLCTQGKLFDVAITPKATRERTVPGFGDD